MVEVAAGVIKEAAKHNAHDCLPPQPRSDALQEVWEGLFAIASDSLMRTDHQGYTAVIVQWFLGSAAGDPDAGDAPQEPLQDSPMSFCSTPSYALSIPSTDNGCLLQDDD